MTLVDRIDRELTGYDVFESAKRLLDRKRTQSRTVKVGYRTLDFSEIVAGLSEGDRAVLSDQDKLRPGKHVRQRVVKVPPRSDLR